MDTGYTAMLLHAIKAIQYRFEKATNGSGENFGNFKAGSHTRTPAEIMNHMYDLVNKTGCRIKEGHFNCPPPALLDFAGEKERLLQALETVKTILATNPVEETLAKKLLQGPMLDMATHVGQLALLNGLCGNRIPKESYFDAELS